MKITWIVSNYPHAQNPQAGIFYKIFAEALVSDDCEITVIAPTPKTGPVLPLLSSKWKQYADAPEEETTNGVRVFRPRYFTLPGETDSRYVHKKIVDSLLRLNPGKTNIIHGFGSYPVNMAAMEYAELLDLRYIHTFIGSDVNDYPHRGPHQMEYFKKVCAGAKQILAVSQALSDKVNELSGVIPKVLYMPIASTPEIYPSKEEVRSRYGIMQDQFAILYAGSLIPEKGIGELCDALKMEGLENVITLFAGPGDAMTSQISATKNTKLLGPLPHAELLSLMHACDVLVLPSHSEGIPGVIKEAGQMKLPVIATHVGGIPEILSEESGYLIPPRDAQSIHAALIHVRNHAEEAAEKAGRLHEKVRNMFDPAILAKKQMDIYTEASKQ